MMTFITGHFRDKQGRMYQLIGEYTFEFTKQGEAAPEIVQNDGTPVASSALFNWVLFFAGLTVLTLVAIIIF